MIYQALCRIYDGMMEKLTELIETVKNKDTKAGKQAIRLDSSCYNVGGSEPSILTPVLTIVDGKEESRVYYNPDNTLYMGVSDPVHVDPCDCHCPPCEKGKCSLQILMEGFDDDNSSMEAGTTTAFRVSNADGIVGTIEHDYTTTSDGVTKSSLYTPLIALINNVPDFTITLKEDVKIEQAGKPVWLITYTGDGNDGLLIEKAPKVVQLGTMDDMTWKIGEDCINKWKSSWDGMGSDPFSEV